MFKIISRFQFIEMKHVSISCKNNRNYFMVKLIIKATERGKVGLQDSSFILTPCRHGPLQDFVPLLFILFIIDKYRSFNQMRFVHFPDGVTVFASDHGINNGHATANRERVGADKWVS